MLVDRGAQVDWQDSKGVAALRAAVQVRLVLVLVLVLVPAPRKPLPLLPPPPHPPPPPPTTTTTTATTTLRPRHPACGHLCPIVILSSPSCLFLCPC
eukprot:751100-Hanusia_phi.AAC.1